MFRSKNSRLRLTLLVMLFICSLQSRTIDIVQPMSFVGVSCASMWPCSLLHVSSAKSLTVEAFRRVVHVEQEQAGPRTEPCGTPHSTLTLSYVSPSTT